MAITAPCNREHQAGLSRHGMGQKHLLLLVTKTSCIFQASDIKDNPAGAIPITSQPNSQRHPIPQGVLRMVCESLQAANAANAAIHSYILAFCLSYGHAAQAMKAVKATKAANAAKAANAVKAANAAKAAKAANAVNAANVAI